MKNASSKEWQLGFAADMKSIGCFQTGQFRIKLHETQPDAPLSPYYINLRRMRSFPRVMKIATQLLANVAQNLAFDFIADVPTAGTPFATLLSQHTWKGVVTPRSDKKGYGSGDIIDGVFKKAQRVLLVDDVITNAGSKLRAIELLREAGLRVTDALVIVDREQGGTEELGRMGCELHSVVGISELLEYYRDHHLVTREQYEQIQSYRCEHG